MVAAGSTRGERWRQAQPQDNKKTIWYLCMGCDSPQNKRTFLLETNSTNQRLCWWVGGGDIDVWITKPQVASNSLFVKTRRA